LVYALELTEECPLELQENPTNDNLITKIHEKYSEKISINHDNFGHIYLIKSNGYVGILPLEEQGSIYIKPKIAVQNIFSLLEYAYNLRSFKLFEGTACISSISEIFENLAMILAKRVLNRNRKGLYHAYVPVAHPLNYIRGRLLIKPTTISVLKGSIQPICEYEEYTADIEENEILLWTLYLIRRFEIKRPEVKQAVRKAYRELVDKVGLKSFNASDCIDRFYNKLNDDYKPLHGVCRFFIEHAGPELIPGSHEMLPFVINMPNLFETFVYEWLKTNLPSEYHVEPQFKCKLDNQGKFFFKVDLVIRSNKTDIIECVLDTKYKKDLASKEDDVAKIIAYAATLKTKKAFLVYPSHEIGAFDLDAGEIKVKSLFFDIEHNIEEGGVDFLSSLKDNL